jgi:CheY-like chemotaxis protein
VCSWLSVDRKFRVRRNKVTAQRAATTITLEQRLNCESGHDRYLPGNKHGNPRVEGDYRSSIGPAKSTRLQGYRVECEADGRTGLNRVQAALPDLVMLDVTMPELNGADVGKAIRSSEATADIPILIQTHFPSGRFGSGSATTTLTCRSP